MLGRVFVVQVELSSEPLSGLDADLHVVGIADGASLEGEMASAAGAGDVKTGFRKTTLLRPGTPERLLVVGLGAPGDLTAERLRVAAAVAAKQAAGIQATSIAWELPQIEGGTEREDAVGAIIDGTVLASYSFDRFKASDPDDEPPVSLDRLVVAAGSHAGSLGPHARTARVAAEASNRVRELQNLPANVLTPERLAERAREISVEFEPVTTEVLGPGEIAERGLGGLVAVSAGSAVEPRLITLRYSGNGGGEVLGLVGKAVTFDSGGISIKPSQGMHEMKMDMTGGAAVIETIAAIAELGLAIDVVAVVPATENMPSGSATRPGDIITQLNGKTVEVNNTDAEGRLILADALTWAVREMGAERIVDIATLTGAVVIALGSTYAALIANDDDWANRVSQAGEETGELVWRLPLHQEYKELTKGTVADLTNAAAKRKAGTIYAGAFLEEFVDDVPWAHVDIAGTAWDTGRAYVGSGASGFGARLLIAVARDLASTQPA